MPVWVQIPPSAPYQPDGDTSTRGDVAKWTKAEVCKTSIRRFESARRLQTNLNAFLYAGHITEPHCCPGGTRKYPRC